MAKLIVTDVEKAFDQAWRDGVIYNLMERGTDNHNEGWCNVTGVLQVNSSFQFNFAKNTRTDQD